MADTAGMIGHDPIERSDYDRLGRRDFAELLAKALAASSERRSMVVALYGDWGSGKTSTLNLCFEALGKLSGEDEPLVVRINPWWYSNTGELLAQFFEELGTALKEQAESKGIGVLKGIRDKLLSYRKLVAPAGAAADLLVSGGAVTVLASLLQAGAERAAQGQETDTDVRKIRGEIEAALAKVERRVVIAIDDIDRLSAPEIRDVFKVVKATADFPNTRSLGSSHDQGRIVRLGISFWLRFGPLAVFRYEFSGLIRAHGATSLLDLPETRSGMSIPVRVLLGDHIHGTPAGALVLFSVRNGRR